MKKWIYVFLALVIYFIVVSVLTLFESNADGSNIKSFSDALWYSIVTLTTVGYGDLYPVTPMGKIVGLLIIISSVGVLGYVIGEIMAKINDYMEKKNQGYWGTDFTDHYVMIGWNEFGRSVAQQILNSGKKIAIVVDSKEKLDLIKSIFETDNCFVLYSDIQNYDSFKKVNIEKAKSIFVNLSDDTETLVFILNLKKKYSNLSFIATCKNASLKDTFMSAGVNYVVPQSEVASRLVASYIFEPQVAEYTEDLITTSKSDLESDIQQYRIIDSNEFANKEYLEIFYEIKQRFNAVAIGLVSGQGLLKNPDNDHLVKSGDYLILISAGKVKSELEKFFGVLEGQ
ncbi:potassium channel family protein [Mangrovivirga sp. M17]|uniref:Potassium channel family protein n=1 Tax=Mangrovivirga halotolerans TaxID=2993936 RepID=A0ABT3RP04_9BACT|nr:potassium channel family protein [Mangrovivirga halotolerans]MCX2742987.1 potassium channel family protein [Mangrovivirga halotolerans]